MPTSMAWPTGMLTIKYLGFSYVRYIGHHYSLRQTKCQAKTGLAGCFLSKPIWKACWGTMFHQVANIF